MARYFMFALGWCTTAQYIGNQIRGHKKKVVWGGGRWYVWRWGGEGGFFKVLFWQISVIIIVFQLKEYKCLIYSFKSLSLVCSFTLVLTINNATMINQTYRCSTQLRDAVIVMQIWIIIYNHLLNSIYSELKRRHQQV